MPVYEYECECGIKRHVQLRSYKDEKEQQCECGLTMKKTISTYNFKVNGYNEKNGYSK